MHLVDNLFDGCAWLFEGAAGATIDLLSALCRDDLGLRAMVAGELGLPPGAVGGPSRRDYH